MESVFVVTPPGHNLGHRSPVHRSRDPVAGVPGPCHCPWVPDQVQGLPAKCSSRELPGGGPGQGGSQCVHASEMLLLCPGFSFRKHSQHHCPPSTLLWFLSVLLVLPHVSPEPDCLPCGQAAGSFLSRLLTFPFLQLLPPLQPSQLNSLGIRLFTKFS